MLIVKDVVYFNRKEIRSFISDEFYILGTVCLISFLLI